MENSQALQNKVIELENEISRLRILAERDGLTGCLRREALITLIDRRRSFGLLPKKMTLVIADIDFFKKVNDTYGHIGGDEVLTAFAKTLQNEVPDGSLICRMGGEEFVILIPGTTEAATLALENLRKQIESHTVKLSDGRKVQITSSFGAANWDSDKSLLGATAEADAALYRAKNQGRNQVAYAA